MRIFIRLMALIAALLVAPMAAQARVNISVDLSSQRMVVTSDGGASYSWPISSARAGYVTPRGTYHPTSLQTMHRSKKYHNSPMPHSIFFNGGYAIHGTYAVGALGRPASHGCIRISPAHASTLFSLVRAEGAVIQIVGSAPVRHYARAGHHGHAYARVAHHRPHAHGTALGYAPHHNERIQRIFNRIMPE
ncbi:L,D-transpeptidase [Rhodoblastus sphagnicola]|uniref:L,D-transpeptidase n=1 Tax=Rhodoblastus sphagnicola TaxID=333368 RepID=A0A2S6MZ98_9HYPH|nr:L,D-transpeptidase [Rhodoblastus sphagnicola]MBB4198611.1 hypothetical protein [Rhodoblastus sphagnicola]PPQ27670.1 L,D-transpeptidase [Rhodoblastus sphagnicola]